MIIFLARLLRRTSDSHFIKLSSHLTAPVQAALTLAGKLVYTRGLLRKGVGLCHGVAGSVFALLALDSVSDLLCADRSSERREEIGREKNEWLARAVHLAHLATGYERMTAEGEMDVPDRRYSLYEGVAGMCCAWTEVLKRMNGEERKTKRVGMPAFDDLF